MAKTKEKKRKVVAGGKRKTVAAPKAKGRAKTTKVPPPPVPKNAGRARGGRQLAHPKVGAIPDTEHDTDDGSEFVADRLADDGGPGPSPAASVADRRGNVVDANDDAGGDDDVEDDDDDRDEDEDEDED